MNSNIYMRHDGMGVLLVFAIMLMLMPGNAGASPPHPYRLYSYILKERLDTEGTKSYNKVLEYVLQDVRDQIKVLPLPLKRGAAKFLDDHNACVFPTAPGALYKVYAREMAGHFLHASAPVDTVSLKFFTRHDRPVIDSKQQISGKKVGLLLGSIGADYVRDNNGILVSVGDEGRLVQLLSKGRIDILLGHHPDTPMAMQRLGAMNIHASPHLRVFSTNTHIVCHDFDGVSALLGKVDHRLDIIRRNGQLAHMLGPYSDIAFPATQNGRFPD